MFCKRPLFCQSNELKNIALSFPCCLLKKFLLVIFLHIKCTSVIHNKTLWLPEDSLCFVFECCWYCEKLSVAGSSLRSTKILNYIFFNHSQILVNKTEL